MICPHCGKPVEKRITAKDRQQVLVLHKQGFSVRDIEAKLQRRVSFSSAARIIREQGEEK